MKTKISYRPSQLDEASNPNAGQNQTRLPFVLWLLSVISIILLILVGGGLFFFPDFSRPIWLWSLTPFNLRFLGAIYLTALVALANLVLAKRAALIRLIVPMMWVFTTVVLLVSCLHIEQFNAGRKTTDIWFWLYLIDCVGASYYLGYIKQISFGGLCRLPLAWSVALGVQAGLLGVYGLGLLIFPEVTSSSWSWPLDVFHSRLYSSIFLTGAIGSAILSVRANAIECRALGVIQVAFSGWVLAGVWVVDSAVKKIDWSLSSNWVWLGAIALPGIFGIGLILQSQNGREDRL
ncbi:hypothetical protein S7335_726 [Synechococcus sp. PCC 7335]|uniref:hypothetical protein n=1 Tax=Synechococcus sp. (strain ATCC 29403 / PCC 7335) TaxID=91464 RepID=UPI00017EC461|nr:hypothetical protein [Synechococcus sp. PCC 7335]EDX83546.1 hypothetical protein S7335_726 [Synechococcus sp. PCC 7335]